MQASEARERENWFDEAFVADWLERQKARAPERERQFAMVRALIPRKSSETFRYLNVGAGDGWLDEELLDRFPRAEAVLLDGSPAMLDQARARLRRFASRTAFVEADLVDRRWTEGIGEPVDVALSTIAIHNLEDPARVRELYREIASVVAPGGFFMNFDYVRAPHPALGELYRFASSDQASGFAAVRGYRDYLGTVGEHLGWLAEAGFAPADCFWRELRTALFGGFKGAIRVPDGR
ncbi:MAG TPA: class I SAM-dependent methyltransferase [Chloroflexota bacterium]|nr:class I SAM-dependent methyltransferase [Chloroflexota bacterium]